MAKTILLHLAHGEVKIEDLSSIASNKILGNFSETESKGKTIRIARNTSEMLPTMFRPQRSRANTNLHPEVTVTASTTADDSSSSSSAKGKFGRTISSKSLKRTFSVGKFNKGSDRIIKSVSKEELSAAADNPTIVKSKTTDRIKDLSDFVKRSNKRSGSSSSSFPGLRKKKSKGKDKDKHT